MWSRRKFVFSTLAGLAFLGDDQSSEAFFDGKQKLSLHGCKPVLLVGEYWSPAIACDFVGALAGDVCCIMDEFGRLIIVDILPAALRSHVFPVLGRLDNVGSKVLDLQVMPQSAIALVWNQSNSRQNKAPEGQFVLSAINLSRVKAPRLVSKINLPDFSEFHALAVRQSLICLAGIDNKGENCLWLYRLKRDKLQKLACLMLIAPVENMLLGSNELLLTYDDSANQASLVDLNNLNRPQFVRTVKLGAQDNQIACSGDVFVLAHREGSGSVIKIGSMKNFPKPSSKLHIDALQSIEAMAMNNDNLMVLGNSAEEIAAVPFLIDKNMNLSQGRIVNLNRRINDQDMTGKLALGKSNAFIGFGWDGVQVISETAGNAWTATASYSVPKLPVASQVAWSNYLVLAGSDLRLYDLKRPAQPELVSVTKLPTTLKEMALAGSYVLCLDQDYLSLRKIDNLPQLVAQMSVCAKKISFDASTKKAYLIQDNGKKDKNQHKITKLLEASVYADKIETSKTFSVVSDAYCSSASDGYVLVGNIDGLAIYKPDQDKELICQRQFQDLAWRDMVLSDGKIFATAVDPDASGFFYAMSFDGSEITVLGVTKIPHDGLALAAREKHALTIGQSPEGSNLLTVIDLSNESSPKVASVQPVLESACSIICTDNLAIVSGRGFEIFKLKE